MEITYKFHGISEILPHSALTDWLNWARVGSKMCLDRPPSHPPTHPGSWIISKLLDFWGSWNLVCKLSYTQLEVPDNLSLPNWHERSTLTQLAWAFDAYLFSKFKGPKVISSVALLQPSLFFLIVSLGYILSVYREELAIFHLKVVFICLFFRR